MSEFIQAVKGSQPFNLYLQTVMKTIPLLFLTTLLAGCGGAIYSAGPLYEETKPHNYYGRIITYLSEDTILSGFTSPSIQVNDNKPSIISRGGYHDYKVHPGQHLLRYNPGNPNEQAIVLDIKQGEIIYIRCTKDINQSKIIPELHKTRKQFSPELPITSLDLSGKIIISKSNRSTRIVSIKSTSDSDVVKQGGDSHLDAGNYNITVSHKQLLGVKPKFSLTASSVFEGQDTSKSFDPHKIDLKAKENCAYIINTLRPSTTSIKFKISEYCATIKKGD